MITVDTNVWVRYLTNDDPAQADRAMALLSSTEAVLVPKTVLLELEWVLRAAYDLPREAVSKALLHVLGLPGVEPEQPEQVARALDLFGRGLDLADALHYVSGVGDQALHTFDVKLARRAKTLGLSVKRV